jgi:hypothetical protein
MGSFKGGPIRGLYNTTTKAAFLYPRSAELLPSIFQKIAQGPYNSLNAENDNPGILKPTALVQNEMKWDPFTIRFNWEAGGKSDPQLKNMITNFINHLREVQAGTPNPDKMPLAELNLDCWGGSIAVTHPNQALLLLRKVVAWEANTISATTDGPNPRNIFNEDSCAEEESFKKAAKFYQFHTRNAPFSLNSFDVLLKHLPAAPYASREAALAMASITNAKKETGRTIIDIAELENAIALDCNKKPVTLPCPHRALH